MWSLQLLGYLRTLSLKFQKAKSKIEVSLALLCWLSQFSCQQGRARKTSILFLAFCNFELEVLKYPINYRLIAILTWWLTIQLLGKLSVRLAAFSILTRDLNLYFLFFFAENGAEETKTRILRILALCALKDNFINFLNLDRKDRCIMKHAIRFETLRFHPYITLALVAHDLIWLLNN